MMKRGRKSLRLTFAVLFALLFQVPARPQARVGAAEERAVAPVASQQQPAKQPELKFAILGDTGTGGREQYEVGKKLAATRGTFPFEFVIMLGDNMYGGESPQDFQNKFEKPYEALLSTGIKFYASLGNHDVPERQIAYKPFNMGGQRYYTFKPKDGVRFFALDSNYMDKKQLEWLENELKSSGSEWKICFFHHPLYSSGEKHGPSLELRKALEPLLIKHGVDVVFAGHEHFYERIKPQNGIQYFILGNSAKLRKGGIEASNNTAKGFDTDNAFMIAEIAGDEMSFQTISRTGTLVDSGKFRRAERKAAATKD
jgi:3',5'-cyclic AMP phosphodiesterase CpdA